MTIKNSSPVLFQLDLLNKKALPPCKSGCRDENKLISILKQDAYTKFLNTYFNISIQFIFKTE